MMSDTYKWGCDYLIFGVLHEQKPKNEIKLQVLFLFSLFIGSHKNIFQQLNN